MNSIQDIIDIWEDKPEAHRHIAEALYHQTNEEPVLKELRDWVEQNSFGHGERCFYAMWDLLIREVGERFSYLEIGIYKGQMIVLIRLLAQLQYKVSRIVGISPMNGAGGFEQRDYFMDVEEICHKFNVEAGILFEGYSTDEDIICNITSPFMIPYDFIFIDGGHDLETVRSDLRNYPDFVKKGGFLVIDDCCNDMHLPEGYFPGIASVTQAVKEWEAVQTDFKFLFSVGHNKVYRKNE